jgi:hypothetical protein
VGPTYQHIMYSNPRQSTQQCNEDALTCSTAAESHHKSGHGRPSHPIQRSEFYADEWQMCTCARCGRRRPATPNPVPVALLHT